MFLKYRLQELQTARNFLTVSLHFKKITNSLRQVLQTYSEICSFLCAIKKYPPEAVSNVDLRMTGKSCYETDGDLMKFIL